MVQADQLQTSILSNKKAIISLSHSGQARPKQNKAKVKVVSFCSAFRIGGEIFVHGDPLFSRGIILFGYLVWLLESRIAVL